jgi:anti-sigma factor RsiW
MKHDTPHPSDETLLCAVHGELLPRRRDTLDTHLAGCDGCRSRLRAIQASADEVTAAWREGAAAGVPPVDRLRARLRAGLEQRSSELDRSWRFRIERHMARVPSAAVAAVAVALVLGAVLIRSAVVRGRSAGSGAAIEAGALPIPAITPGATAYVTADDLCAGRGPVKEEIAPAVRQAVLRDYGMDGLPDSDYELDYLITPELGGSSDRRNLRPQRTARV